MSKLKFNKLDSKEARCERVLKVQKLNDDTKKYDTLGYLYLNYNEQYKNDTLFSKCLADERLECQTLVKEFNKEKRLIESFKLSDFSANNFYANQNIIQMAKDISSSCNLKPLSQVIMESIEKEIFEATKYYPEARQICDDYNYDYRKLDTNKHINVFKVYYDDIEKLIKSFLSIDSDEDNLLANLNDYLLDFFNTDKQYTLDKIYLMSDKTNKFFAKAYLLGAMIDIMMSYGVNPVDDIDVSIVFFYWYQIRLLKLHETEAIKEFVKEFNIDSSEIEKLQKPLVELITRPVSDKYIGLE